MCAVCWFCGATESLRPHERAYDSAPLLNLDGSPQMICADCHADEADYRQRIEYEYARVEEDRQRKRDTEEGF